MGITANVESLLGLLLPVAPSPFHLATLGLVDGLVGLVALSVATYLTTVGVILRFLLGLVGHTSNNLGVETTNPTPRGVLITGASGGIGEELAYKYSTRKLRLILTGRNEERLLSVQKRCLELGASDVVVKVIDVTDAAAMDQFLKQADDASPIDLVIINAGISGSTARAREYADKIREVFDVNVTGALNSFLPLLDRLKQRRRGQIAFVSSISAIVGPARAAAYNASKSAVYVLGKDLRQSLKRYGIRVSVIAPGYVVSSMSRAAAAENRHPLFLVPTSLAVDQIAEGLDQNIGLITFPYITFLFARIFQLFPSPLVELLSKYVADPDKVEWDYLG